METREPHQSRTSPGAAGTGRAGLDTPAPETLGTQRAGSQSRDDRPAQPGAGAAPLARPLDETAQEGFVDVAAPSGQRVPHTPTPHYWHEPEATPLPDRQRLPATDSLDRRAERKAEDGIPQDEPVEEGVLFGDELEPFTIHGDGFSATYLLDEFNQRLTVVRFTGEIDPLVQHLLATASSRRLTKLSLKASAEQWEDFISHGFVLEGILKGYFRGAHAYLLARFQTGERRHSERFDEAIAVMERVRQDEVNQQLEDPQLPGYQIERAAPDDALELVDLYTEVFESYPTPLHQASAIRRLMEGGALFRVAKRDGRIVSAASAAVDRDWASAEMTHCATAPSHRGRGLMRVLLTALEDDLRGEGIQCAYGMARALSPGINLVFKRLGYTYQGRAINHCHIMGAFQDLNVWVKALRGPRIVQKRDRD